MQLHSSTVEVIKWKEALNTMMNVNYEMNSKIIHEIFTFIFHLHAQKNVSFTCNTLTWWAVSWIMQWNYERTLINFFVGKVRKNSSENIKSFSTIINVYKQLFIWAHGKFARSNTKNSLPFNCLSSTAFLLLLAIVFVW
jgi:hypothetical protein